MSALVAALGFALGLYCVDDARNFPAIAQAGFDFVQGYRFEIDSPFNTNEAAEAYLNAAYFSGLKVLMGLPQTAVRLELMDVIRDRVIKLKDHPALFGWQLYDEPESDGVPSVTLKTIYALVKSLDPIHPVSIATSLTLDATYPYLDAADVYMPDFFPIPFFSPADINIDIDAAVATAAPGKTVSPHIQIYNLANDSLIWPAAVPRSLGRYPTYDEMRFMAYYALIRGSQNVVLNCYKFDDPAGPGWGEDFSTNPVLWQPVAQVASDIRRQASILALPTISRAAAGSVDAMVKTSVQKIYVISANTSPLTVWQGSLAVCGDITHEWHEWAPLEVWIYECPR